MRLLRIAAAAGAMALATAVMVAAPAQAATTTVTDWTALDAAFDNAADGDVVILGVDIDATGSTDYLSVPLGRGVTLDLNGHTLTLAPTAGPGIRVGDTSSLTIDDAIGTGKVNATGSPDVPSSLYYPGIGADNADVGAGTVTIRGGAVTARGSQFAAGIGGARFKAGGPVIMTGGTLTAISGTSASSVGAGQFVFGDAFAGTVTVEGAEDATGLPTTAGAGSPDTEPAPITYTTPTPGVIVTGSTVSPAPETGVLTLAFHYRVTFAFADGTTPDSTQVVDWGAHSQVPVDPVRAGYTFAGWTPSTPGTTPTDAVKTPLVFTALWTPVVVTPSTPPATGPSVHTGGSVASNLADAGDAGLAATGNGDPWIPFAIGLLLTAAGAVGLFRSRATA